MKRLFIMTTLVESLLTGCKVGHNYRKPVVRVPTAYHGPSENQQAQAASYADLPWWQGFQAPVLQDLIRTTLKQNYDLQTATESITYARAQLIVTHSNQLPQVSLTRYG